MGDLATHSVSYPVENGQISPFSINAFEMDERLFCNYSAQQNNSFYQDRENGEEEILNNYDFLHWPELGKHMTSVSRLKPDVDPREVSELLEQESTFTFHEDAERLKLGCSNDSKPQTYASVLQKTLKLKLDNNKSRIHDGSHVSKNDNEEILYSNSKDNNNVALVLGDQKFFFEWNFFDLSSQNISESFDRQESQHLTQIYSDFMRNALENYPPGKEFLEFSSLLTLIGSRIEMQEIDGMTQIYYCLNKGWTEEDSETAHKSYLPHCCYSDTYCETDLCQDNEKDVLSAKAQAVCTFGFDLNTALNISKDLWDCNKPRMAYTQMFNVD